MSEQMDGYRKFVTSFICTVLGLGSSMGIYCGVVVSPTKRRAQAAEWRAQELARDLASARHADGNMDRLQKEIGANREELAATARMLPPSLDSDAEAREVMKAFKDRGMAVALHQPAPSRDRDFYREHEVEIEVDGADPAAFFDAIEELHGREPMCGVASGSIEIAAGDTLDATLQVTSFNYLE